MTELATEPVDGGALDVPGAELALGRRARLGPLWHAHVRSSMLPRFLAVGALSVGTDVVLLFLLHSVVGVHLAIATSVGYFTSLVVNYSLNHSWTFNADGQHGRRMLRYLLLVAINYASTIGFVTGLTALGAYYLVSKLVAIAVNAVLNYVVFFRWVFR